MSQFDLFFKYEHLPKHLQDISEQCCNLHDWIDQNLSESSAEKTAGLRKLLEAKDCFVRAKILEKDG